MKISVSTKKTEETKATKYSCEFCKREFVKERTLVSHLCEYKQRWLSKDNQGNRIGFQTFLQFFKKHSASKKLKTYEEFIKSPYYMAFVKFGNYVTEINCISVPRYCDWLLKENIKLDNWCQDTNYNRFLIDHLKIEDPFDAIHRSVEFCIELAQNDNIQTNDVLRYSNPNRICYAITTGKISPWMLYCSDSGTKFLETLNPDHVTMIIDYINPEQWALKFHREPELTKQVKDLLDKAGY